MNRSLTTFRNALLLLHVLAADARTPATDGVGVATTALCIGRPVALLCMQRFVRVTLLCSASSGLGGLAFLRRCEECFISFSSVPTLHDSTFSEHSQPYYFHMLVLSRF